MLLYELTRWWAYRRIEHPQMRTYVWVVPLLFTVVTIVIYGFLPAKPPLAGNDGLLKSVSQIFALLPGFFISALAAVATFNRPEMDETMPGNAPKALIRHQGSRLKIPLTRRMFLSYLFSYLAVLSIILFIATIASPIVYVPIAKIMLENGLKHVVDIARYAFVACLCYFSYSLFVSTLHGVYFLCERIHQPNS